MTVIEILYWSYFVLASIIFFIVFSDNNNFLKVLLGFIFGGALLLMIPVLPIFLIGLIPENYLLVRKIVSGIYLSFLILLCCRYLFIKFSKYQEKTISEREEKTVKSPITQKVNPEIPKPQTKVYTTTSTKGDLDVNQPKPIYKNPTVIEQKKVITKVETFELKAKAKSEEQLPKAKVETTKSKDEIIFVNYDILKAETTNFYPVFRFPKKGTVVRSYRLGNTKRRGFKEESFQKSIEQYFGKDFTILGNARLNTGKETRPFEPDIAIIDKSNANIRIDIEIDEPYAGVSRQPTHCKGEDVNRDIYFVDRGWIVIRFSEYQVHLQEKDCLRFIAETIKSAIPNYEIPNTLVNQPVSTG